MNINKKISLNPQYFGNMKTKKDKPQWLQKTLR